MPEARDWIALFTIAGFLVVFAAFAAETADWRAKQIEIQEVDHG